MEYGTSIEDGLTMNNDDIANLWIFKFLQFICPEYLYEEIEGDLIQKFNHDVKSLGEKRARRRLVWNAIKFCRPGIILRNKFAIELNQGYMIQNYFLVTFRHLWKNKINAASKMGGLALALFSLLTIYLYVFYQLSFDRYHDGYENIYRVNTQRKEADKIEKYGIAPLALGPMLYQRFPEIECYTRLDIANYSHIQYNQKVVRCGVFPADSSLFNVFTFKFIKGGKDALQKPNSIVLNQSTAYAIFGNEDPMNKIINVNNDKKLYVVTAVIEDMRPNSHLRIDAFIPIVREASFAVSNMISPVELIDKSSALYVKFRKGTDSSLFSSKLESLLDRYVNKKDREQAGFKIFLQPVKDIYFDVQFTYQFSKNGNKLYLYVFIVLGIFLLAVSCINYINLTVADFTSRSREIGVRKVMGALKKQIVAQIFFETLFFCCCALIISIVALYGLFPDVSDFLEPNLKFEMLLLRPVAITLAFTLFIIISFSTALPAYWLVTSNTILDLKGNGVPNGQNAMGKTLLVAQFTISIICISATITIGRQLDYIHGKDIGIERKNLVVLSIPEDFQVNKIKSLKAGLKSIQGVESVSNSSFRIGGGFWKDWYAIESGDEMKSVELYEVFSDDDLFNTLGMKLLEGRLFNDGFPADSGKAFVINQTAAKALGWENPIGKHIYTHPEEPGKWDGTVVGVVADINIRSLHQKIQPMVMRLPWQNKWPEPFVYMKINGPVEKTIQAIKRKYNDIEPGYPVDLEFVEDLYNSNYKEENKAFDSLQFGTIIIILISLIGIFSLSAYMSLRRMKEFGIRKVLGATVNQIMILHISHFMRLALIANVIAIPISYWLMKEWLDGFAYRTELSGLVFIFVTGISFLLVIISGGYSAWKAGRLNPVEVIKIQ